VISEDLRAHLLHQFPERRIADIRMGLGYTAVLLEDGNMGVAYTFRQEGASGCSVFSGRRPLAGRSTTEILEYVGSDQPIEASLGLAVANAMTNRPGPNQQEGDILDFLPLRADDRVGMVGFFAPLVGPLEKLVRELVIFERDTSHARRALPAQEALSELPKCDVALITSTSLIVGTLDRLLEAAAGCREVALVGASTPLLPETFRPRGVTLLSGIIVTDPTGILQIVSEGGGMGFFGKRIRKINVRLPSG
jgi:uncharacterized protein (DUF4213/DUF364 family)